jgi:hypothetical protein
VTLERDAVLVNALHRVVTDLSAWLGDYPDDQVSPGAVAVTRASIDWVIEQLPAGQRDRLSAGDPDPASLKALTGLVADLIWWLDTCDDDEVDPDVAVKLQEAVAAAVDGMSDEQRQRLVEIVDELTTVEAHRGRRYELRRFPFAVGLVDDEPDEEEPPARTWTPPEARPASHLDHR